MSTFESIRCDQCGKETPQAIRWGKDFQAIYQLPVNWMTVHYSIPHADITGVTTPSRCFSRDFCSIACRNTWEVTGLAIEKGERHGSAY